MLPLTGCVASSQSRPTAAVPHQWRAALRYPSQVKKSGDPIPRLKNAGGSGMSDTPHDENCSAAKAAGAAPVHAGQPSYRRHLDRDGDGIGCE